MPKREAEGAALRDLRARGFLMQDLLGVAAGLRPLCHSGAPRWESADRAAFDAFLGASGLKALKRESAPGAPPLLTVGRDAAALEEFEAVCRVKSASLDEAETLAATARMGELLGYPACCAAAFAASERARIAERSDAPWSFARAVLERSGPGPFRFPANFLYNFHSRSSGPGGELGRLLRGGYGAMDRFLVPWIPCRFDCAPTVAFGERLLEALRGVEPAFADSVRGALSSLIVLFDDWSFVPLAQVRRDGREWYYGGVLDARTLAPSKTVELLRAGDRLLPSGEVFLGETKLGRVAGSPALFDFSA